MKKMITGMLVCSLALSLAGCETLPKKFIRKKKEPAHKTSTVFLQEEGDFQKPFSNDYYYKTHYTLWQSWQDEIISNLTGNSKKLRRSADEAYSHLDQMTRYLKPAKAAELKTIVGELDALRKRFDTVAMTKSSAATMRPDLERIRRQVTSDFYYDKVRGDVLEDVVKLE